MPFVLGAKNGQKTPKTGKRRRSQSKLPEVNHSVRERAKGLFRFLREFSELKTRTIESIDSYDAVLWLSEIPKDMGCHTAAWFRGQVGDDANLDTWIEIEKPKLARYPRPPAEIRDWLEVQQLSDSSLEMPSLRAEILVERKIDDEEDQARTVDQPQLERLKIDDHPEIAECWEKYVENEWWPWAEVDRRLQPIQAIYTKLFSIHQMQQRLGEQYEVILGQGLLKWRLQNGHTIRRHLVVAQTSIEFSAGTGVIKVGPAGEGAKLTLEQDMLDPRQRPEPELLTALQTNLDQVGDSVWDQTQIDSVLKGWTHAASADSDYSCSLEEGDVTGHDPSVFLAPALMLRRRTERSYIRAFTEILNHLNGNADIPSGVERFVAIADEPLQSDRLNEDSPRDEPHFSPPEDIYFPLEANEAQFQVVQHLRSNQGVLVQGPPGTGKSHTIVNLISHLLATGNRVLVTSHTARALRVLRRFFEDRLPDLSPLAVVVLGDDRESLQAMEDSVQGITERHNHWDAPKNEREIDHLTNELHEAWEEQARLETELRAFRERETYKHSLVFGDYQGSLQKIAQAVRANSAQYEWFRDRPGEDQKPPLSNEEAASLSSLLRNASLEEIDRVIWRVVDPKQLVPPEEFNELLDGEDDLNNRFNETQAHRGNPNYQAFRSCTEQVLTSVEGSLRELVNRAEHVNKHIEPWTDRLIREVLADQDRPWWELLKGTAADLNAIRNIPNYSDEIEVFGVEGKAYKAVKADATSLSEHLRNGGRWGIAPFRSDVVKKALYLRNEVRLDGQRCDSEEALKQLIAWIDVQLHLKSLRRRWQSYTEIGDYPVSVLIAKYEDLCEPIEAARQIYDIVRDLQVTVKEILGFVEPTWYDLSALRATLASIDALGIETKLSEKRQAINKLSREWQQRSIEARIDPELQNLIAAVDARDSQSYASAVGKISTNYKFSEALNYRGELFDRLVSSAPKLASELRESRYQEDWGERLAQFDKAWNWARAKVWVRRQGDPKTEEELWANLVLTRNRIRDNLAKITTAKAWRNCFSALTVHERQHLVAWTKAMQRIGKGTGKYAPKHRKAARAHMEECRTAIPAWVMPLYRVAETMRPGKDLFDVAIVDEASQSGPEALLLTYLAKQLIVVGDSKQISPDYVGVNRSDVDQLRQRYIAELPHSDSFGADNSFFDLAEIRYQGRIRLREHFRCMPEIIQFSNNLCYAREPLEPLRQYTSSRITPVVEAVYLANGYIKGTGAKQINPTEAESVVERIVNICENREYSKKTIGVISLLGNQQARNIEQLLLDALGPEEIGERQIVCGDAYAFQGDERDIVLLSMVSAVSEGRRIGTLTSARDERRFNVAASRARDQLVLFHSVTINDLGHQCLRRRLLEYCQHPVLDQLEISGISASALRAISSRVNRSTAKPPEPFDSWFEVDVFLDISNRGYRVIPQYELAGYRIDLLVDGFEGRLAVECDGDEWHGSDRYEADMGRQRKLERCGMHFSRIRGSTYYLDPEAALEELWEELARRGVHPSAQLIPAMEISTRAVSEGHIEDAEPVSEAIPVTEPQIDHVAAELSADEVRSADSAVETERQQPLMAPAQDDSHAGSTDPIEAESRAEIVVPPPATTDSSPPLVSDN